MAKKSATKPKQTMPKGMLPKNMHKMGTGMMMSDKEMKAMMGTGKPAKKAVKKK